MEKQQEQDTTLSNVLNAARQSFYYVAGFSFFVNLLMLSIPVYMLQIFDRVLPSFSYDTLFYLTLIGIFALIVLSLLDGARSRILINVSLWFDTRLSPLALHKVPDQMLQGSSYGAQATRDITQIRQFLASTGVFTLFDSPWVPIYLLVIFMLHPLLGIFATAGAITLFILALLNEICTKNLLKSATSHSILANQELDLSLRNAEAIQAMGMMSNVVAHWQNANQSVLKCQGAASFRASYITSISKFVRLAMQMLILGLGAYLVIQNELTAGGMIAGSILLTRALAPVEQAIGVWRQWISTRTAYGRLKEHFNAHDERTLGIQLPAAQGHLCADHVSYGLGDDPDSQKIIHDVSFTIEPKELVGLIGPTGAGKSTLARLMVGIYQPTKGVVRLDSADVYKWDREDIGQYIGYMPQDVELFPASIKENIARLGEIDDQAVIEAAKLAHVHEIILKMPNGYNTNLKEVAISGGQRQRIALARALYKNPKLLVLDEPNANLDVEGELALAQALAHMKARGSTIIVISHRPSIISKVDRLILLNKGGIQLTGGRDEVLATIKQSYAQKKEDDAGRDQT